MTFGIASPIIAFAGVVGILTKGLVLSLLAERWDEKVKCEGKQHTVSEAQGLPFRCVVLLVFCSMAFFGVEALVGGIASGYDRHKEGVFVFFGVVAMLILEVLYLFRSDIRQMLASKVDSESGGDGEEEKKEASAARKSSWKKATADGDAAAAFGFNVAGIGNFGVDVSSVRP